MRARAKRAFVSVLALAALASTLVGLPAAAQTDVRVTAVPARDAVQIQVAAVVSYDLCAKEGTVTLPGTPDPVPIWGLALGDCASAGPATLPGPMLNVDEGDTLMVTLHNSLAENVSLVFPGQNLVPDYAGAAPGGSKLYSFMASDPGTYVYAAGRNPAVQVPMGLYGALVVDSSDGGTAYGAGTGTAFNRQAVLVLSEIDPNLNDDPAAFNPADWKPTYWLVNGTPYDPLAPPATIAASQGAGTLLRYVNAGLEHHSMMLLGLHQRVVAKDATPLNAQFDAVSETIPAGQTADMIVSVPGSVALGETYPVYSRQLHLTNGPDFPGGMLRFLEVVTPAPAPAAVGVVPDIRSVGATVRGHRVRVVAQTVGCRPCEARARLKVGNRWRTVRMSRVNGSFVGVFADVPSGRHAYLVAIEDLDSGIGVRSDRRFVRVP